jgi:hypothetical protein
MINRYIDGWMERLDDRTRDYVADGLSLEAAIERATYDIRMEIRRAPALDLN